MGHSSIYLQPTYFLGNRYFFAPTLWEHRSLLDEPVCRHFPCFDLCGNAVGSGGDIAVREVGQCGVWVLVPEGMPFCQGLRSQRRTVIACPQLF